MMLLAAVALLPAAAEAHAIAGMRLFPATLGFDDPGVAAELPLVFNSINTGNGVQDTFSTAYAQLFTKKFGLVVSGDYQQLVPQIGPSQRGWDNFTVAAAYQIYKSDADESIGMLQLADTPGGSGSRAIGTTYSTYTPEFAFGQGFGFLPYKLRYLQPFALTGAVSENFPANSAAPRMLNWALSIQYSIPYLQNFVRYANIKAPFNNMIPIIEIPMQTCLDAACPARTTGYIDPGVIWIGHYFQWGVELQVPTNRASGNRVGILFGVDFYFDDLYPHSLGAPIFN
ncbi:MAG: hypothetical protein KGJ56_01200 [Gammaproteobacteria bacterium]|nr:hypothetical protein [Gammaproteobacteria bacterium]